MTKCYSIGDKPAFHYGAVLTAEDSCLFQLFMRNNVTPARQTGHLANCQVPCQCYSTVTSIATVRSGERLRSSNFVSTYLNGDLGLSMLVLLPLRCTRTVLRGCAPLAIGPSAFKFQVPSLLAFSSPVIDSTTTRSQYSPHAKQRVPRFFTRT